jgi:O-antigen/teichoic acid export membrane protein
MGRAAGVLARVGALRGSAIGLALRRLRSAAAWQVSGAIFNQGSTLLLGIVIANLLGREAYGSFAVVLSTIMMVGGVAQFGLPLTITRSIAELRVRDPHGAAGALALCLTAAAVAGLLCTLLTALLSDVIAARVASQPQLAPLLLLAAPAILLTVVNGVLTAVLAGLEHFRYAAISGIVGGTIYLVLGTAAASRWQLQGAVIGVVATAAAQCLLLLYLVRRETHAQALTFESWPRSVERARLLRFAIPAATAGLVAAPALWILTTQVARGNDGLTQVALFSAANSIRLMVLFVPHLVNGVAFSLLNNARGAEDGGAYRATFWANLAGVTIVASAGAGVAYLLAPYILRLFGPSFSDALPAVGLILLAVIPEAAGVCVAQIALAHGRMWQALLLMTLPMYAVTIGVSSFLSPRWGAAGASGAVLAGNSVGMLAAVALAWRLGLSPARVADAVQERSA